MADYVGLEKTEYGVLQTRLKALHEQEAAAIKALIRKVEGLLGDGFYARQTNQTVWDLLHLIEGNVLSDLNRIHEETEKIIESYIECHINLDQI